MHPFEMKMRRDFHRFHFDNVLTMLKKDKKLSEVPPEIMSGVHKMRFNQYDGHAMNPLSCEACAMALFIGIRAKDGASETVAMGEVLFMAGYFSTCLQYKRSKVIYDFDSKLIEQLKRSSFRDIPDHCVKLPKGESCIFNMDGTYFILQLRERHLNITELSETSETGPRGAMSFDLGMNRSLSEIIEVMNEHITTRPEAEQELMLVTGDRNLREFFALIMGALLYILGDADTVREIHPGANPKKISPGYIDPKHGRQPLVFQVGKKYRRYIERYELDYLSRSKSENPEDTGRTMPPHIRSGHFALRWCGPNRDQAKIVFIQQCWVNGELLDFNDYEPDITDVK